MTVSVSGAGGVQVGDGNVQHNLSAAGLPPPQTVSAAGLVHNLPPASGVFVGRDPAELAALLPAAAIHGLGGIGKSELALHYAREHAERYELIWWLTADAAENVGLGLAALTGRLHPVATLADAEAWATGWLQSHTGWLLILDNVEDVDDVAGLLGQVAAQGHVILTTRRDLGRARWARLRLAPLRLGVLDRGASVRMLTELTGQPDPGPAGRLAADLGDLPLALEQAGAYISQRDGLDLEAYRTLLARRFARVAAAPGEGGTAQRTVASVWQVTMESVRDRSALADRVLRILAWLAPEALPDGVLGPLAPDPADVTDALALLASYNMIGRDAGTVGVHRLVQAVTRAEPPAGGLDEAVALLRAAVPDDPIRDAAGWPRWNALLPHIDAVLGHLPATHTNVTALYLGERAAAYLHLQGQVAAAIPAFERVLAGLRRVLGEEHPNTLITRGNLAAAHADAGRLDEAIAEFERLLGEHPNTVTIRGNLAAAYRDAGRVDEAIELYEGLLDEARRALGDDDPGTLTTRGNLAVAYRDAGRVEEAIELYEGLLDDSRRVLGVDHLGTLNTRSNLAVAYAAAGRPADALAVLRPLLTDARRALGDEHPLVATVRRVLAGLQDA